MGSKSRLMPSAPRSRTAAAACRARLRRALGLPRNAAWVVRWLDVQAHLVIVSTTRVLVAWAELMTLVIRELAQPPQPVVVAPVEVFLSRLPFLSAPTLK